MVSSSFKILEFLFSISAISEVLPDGTYSLRARLEGYVVQVPRFRARESWLDDVVHELRHSAADVAGTGGFCLCCSALLFPQNSCAKGSTASMHLCD